MNRWYWPLGLAIVLVALAQAPATARADSLRPGSALFKLDLTWTASLLPALPTPADDAEPPPLLSFDDAPNQLFSLEAPSRGLQFSLNPDSEEVFLGWQFEF